MTFTTAAATTATVSTGTSGTITQTSFIISGNNITNTGGATVTERGVVYMTGTSGDPTTSNSKSSETGSYGTGTYDRTVSGLTASTSYRVRAFAINSAGTAYGSTITVETSAPVAPTVTTSATFDSITATSATANGNLTATGGAAVTRRGFCYMLGTTGDPTTANSVAYDDSAGFSTGAYTKGLSSLDSGKKYRVRAYAVNSAGTGYGTTQQLTLTNTAPTVALGTNVVDTAEITDTTPSFEFTGTDANSDDIRYNIQIDTVNTFDSNASYLEMDGYSTRDTARALTDTSGVSKVAQSFTGNGEAIKKVSFQIAKGGIGHSPTGNVYAKLYAHSGTFGTSSVPTGSALATSDAVDASTVLYPNDFTTLTEFTFSTPYSTSNGTKYCVSIEYDGGSNNDNIAVSYRSIGADHSGNRSEYTTSWSAQSTHDVMFHVYYLSGGSLIDHTSNVETTAFVRAGDSDPFTSGQEVVYTVPGDDALTADTYYWRVRGMDPTGSATYGAWSTTRSFTLSAGTAANSTRSLYTKGKATSSSTRSLYTKGKLTSSSERGIYTKGKVTTSSERSIYTEGSSTGTQASSERGIYTKGVATSSSERSLYTRGKLSSSSERGIYSKGQAAVENWLTGWDYRVKVTVKASEVDANLTDFPVYVDLSALPAGFHTNVNQTDARDIRVTTSDGETEVPREVVFYTAATDTGELHFKGNISASTDTDFYIYYGNSSATEPARDATYGLENVWNSNYKLVMHLQEQGDGTTDEYKDSTQYANHGTGGTGDYPTRTTSGALGYAQDFSANYIVVPTDASISITGDLTLQAIVTTDSLTQSNNFIFDKRPDTSFTGYFLTQRNNDDLRFLHGNTGHDMDYLDMFTSTSAWHFITATDDISNTTDGMKVYKNAGTPTTDSTTGTPINSGNLVIGDRRDSSGTYSWAGLIDEIRISATPLESGWISTEYNNQSSPSTFFTIGTQEEPSTGTAASSERSLYTKAKATSSSERSLYTKGSVASSSERSVHTIADADTSSERNIHTTSNDTSSSERGIYTKGVLTSSSERAIYSDGSVSTSSTRDIYSKGVASGSSERDIHTIGSIDQSSERNLYTKGTNTDSSERNIYTDGSSTASSERAIRTTGVLGGDSERGIYTKGASTSSSERNIHTTGSIDQSSERDIYSKGIATSSSTRNVHTTGSIAQSSERGIYSKGIDTSSSTREIHTKGSVDQSSERNVYSKGIDTSSSSRNVYTKGSIDANSERSLYTKGIDTATSERDIHTTGSLDNSSERSIHSSGKVTTSSSRNIYTTGQIPEGQGESSRSIYTKGVDTSSSQRSIHSVGGGVVSSERGIHTIGEALSDSQRGVYTKGVATDSSQRNIFTKSSDTDSSERNIHTISNDTNSSSRDIHTTGSLDSSSERSIHSTGKETASSERTIYTEGDIANFSERSIYTKGIATTFSERRIYTTGGVVSSSERLIHTVAKVVTSSQRGLYTKGSGTDSSERNLHTKGAVQTTSERGIYSKGGVAASSQRSIYTKGASTGVKKFKRWNGTAWVDVTLKRYNGSSWETVTIKRFNGSTWEDIP